MRATQQDGSYPRPMLCREQWTSLDGSWQFARDDAGAGLAERWFGSPAAGPFARTVTVPNPPELPASGVGDPGIHPVAWFRRTIAHDALAPAGRDILGVHDYTVDAGRLRARYAGRPRLTPCCPHTARKAGGRS